MRQVYLIKIKAESSQSGTARARLSSIERDRMGDIVEPRGLTNREAYLRGSPVLLFDHGNDPVIARRPVGVMQDITVSDRDLIGEWRWSQAPEGRDIQQRWEAGELNAVSIGFLPLAMEPLTDGRGWRYTKWQLAETSVVSLPACESCLAIRSHCRCEGRNAMEYIDIDEDLVRELVRAVVQQQVMQLTGTLDSGAMPMAITPWGQVPRAAKPKRASRQRQDEVVLELSPESPAERQRRQYREAGIAFRAIDNSVLGDLARRRADDA